MPEDKPLSFEDLKILEPLVRMKYTILRRAIKDRAKPKGGYTIEELTNLCYEIEGKTLKELQEIHKKWIGY